MALWLDMSRSDFDKRELKGCLRILCEACVRCQAFALPLGSVLALLGYALLPTQNTAVLYQWFCVTETQVRALGVK